MTQQHSANFFGLYKPNHDDLCLLSSLRCGWCDAKYNDMRKASAPNELKLSHGSGERNWLLSAAR